LPFDGCGLICVVHSFRGSRAKDFLEVLPGLLQRRVRKDFFATLLKRFSFCVTAGWLTGISGFAAFGFVAVGRLRRSWERFGRSMEWNGMDSVGKEGEDVRALAILGLQFFAGTDSAAWDPATRFKSAMKCVPLELRRCFRMALADENCRDLVKFAAQMEAFVTLESSDSIKISTLH
jgi:hypothetical protein